MDESKDQKPMDSIIVGNLQVGIVAMLGDRDEGVNFIFQLPINLNRIYTPIEILGIKKSLKLLREWLQHFIENYEGDHTLKLQRLGNDDFIFKVRISKT